MIARARANKIIRARSTDTSVLLRLAASHTGKCPRAFDATARFVSAMLYRLSTKARLAIRKRKPRRLIRMQEA